MNGSLLERGSLGICTVCGGRVIHKSFSKRGIWENCEQGHMHWSLVIQPSTSSGENQTGDGSPED